MGLMADLGNTVVIRFIDGTPHAFGSVRNQTLPQMGKLGEPTPVASPAHRARFIANHRTPAVSADLGLHRGIHRWTLRLNDRGICERVVTQPLPPRSPYFALGGRSFRPEGYGWGTKQKPHRRLVGRVSLIY
jgi:hypothetical protein